jgi:hypothetical protein
MDTHRNDQSILVSMLKNFLRPQVTNFCNKLECFVLGKLFQPSLLLLDKARSY